ncbi:MAG: AMP-binding protein [Burkholderiales bacterium]
MNSCADLGGMPLLLERMFARSAPLHIWRGRDAVETIPADLLLAHAQATARRLAHLGIAPGSLVALGFPARAEFVSTLLGTWLCGATAVVLSPAALADGGAGASMQLGAVAAAYPHRLLLHDRVDAPWSAAIGAKAISLEHLAGLPEACSARPESARAAAAALLQFTSGSTGAPKAVPLDFAMLAANCRAIAERAAIGSTDHIVSWLPLNHDMGMVAITMALWSDATLTLLPTDTFSANPVAWLEAVSAQRGTLSPNPVFAYGLLARFGPRLQRLGVDLSSLRYAWAGAEPVFPGVLSAFASALAPCGLRETALQPAYGMAEAVVAVTGGRAGEPYRVLQVDGMLFRRDGRVRAVAPGSDGALAFVSNGAPLDGVRVRVIDEAGTPLPDGCEGEILVAGPNVATGYLPLQEGERFAGGWFRTGDLGFLYDRELYVSGRRKDLLIRGGVKVGARHVESCAEAVLGLRAGQVGAFSYMDHAAGREEIVLVVGRAIAGEEARQARLDVARAVANGSGLQADRIEFVNSARLPRTTSGKLMRGLLRDLWAQGRLTGTTKEEVHEPVV